MVKNRVVRFRQHHDPCVGALVAAGHIYQKAASSVEAVYDRVLEDFAVVYLLEGGGFYRDDLNGDIELRSGDVITLFPDLAHSYGNRPGQKWSEAWLVFQGDLFRQLEREGLLKRNRPVLSPGLDPSLVAAFDRLIREFDQRVRPSDAVASARIHLLLADIVERHNRRHDPGEIMGRARAMLEERLDEAVDAKDVARALGIGYEHFRKQFTRAVGMPPARYRMLRRIDYAKSLLVNGDQPVSDIAQRLGYCDVYFFSRQFKKMTRQSPAAFRKNFNAGS
jgi:AraC-like DNA-binding protein